MTHEDRSKVAEAAWSTLSSGGHDNVRLSVQCARGHHVATVYATDAGLVYVAPVRAHSHAPTTARQSPTATSDRTAGST